MKIALVGYGKMGKAIEKIALSRGHEIIARIDRGHSIQPAFKADIAIEFTAPQSVLYNIEELITHKIPTVCGTTGWNDHEKRIKSLVLKNQSKLIYASNFSLGVNIFFEVNKRLAQMMNKFKDYHPQLTEIHHKQKLDAPSGTAISLFDQINKEYGNKNWHLGTDTINNSIPINAIREEDVKGTHLVTYSNEIDTIEIKHEAHSRDGFALGAVIAAEWLYKSESGTFTMKEVLGL